MSKTNSFKLLWEAIKDSRQSMWVSVQVLIVLTLVLATIFFIAEYDAHEEQYSYWDSLTWAFTRYIDDPGEFSDIAPVTVTGRWMATLIGIISILLFAVPAGIIGGAFNNAIDDEIRKQHLVDVGERLKKAFRRKQDSKTMYKVVPRYISLGTLQALKNMTQNDVVDAVEYNPPFRLRNLATAEVNGTHALDQLVVEMFPYNTPYGCCIDRRSDITIVCPTGVSEAGAGNFAFYLALIGGFNYISKEVEPDVDDPTSYYIINDENKNEHLKQYLADLKRLSSGEDRWTVFIISSESKKENELHFLTKANAKTGRESTVTDAEAFNRLWNMVTTDLKEETGITADLNELRPVGPKNVAVRIGAGETTNAFTIRVSSEFLVWDTRNILAAKSLAQSLALTLGQSYAEKMTDPRLLKESGFGYL
ncbi:MAG: two pore domain potassium channel family protein [Muribaculaceae bacterium]|nr:two pore domain potassium channel family protein [Muribaculaceae bacterium]